MTLPVEGYCQIKHKTKRVTRHVLKTTDQLCLQHSTASLMLTLNGKCYRKGWASSLVYFNILKLLSFFVLFLQTQMIKKKTLINIQTP